MAIGKLLGVCVSIALPLSFGAASAGAELDVDALAKAYKAYDQTRRDGKGYSENPDSGNLGWGEGSVIHSYALMWEATEDAYWLEKIREHFHAIMATASDPDGDGYLSWRTKSYSCAVAHAERLLNVSDARIEPAVQKNTSGKESAKCTGQTFLIEFPNGADRYRIVNATGRKPVVADAAYKSGDPIKAIEPFTLRITGQAHQGDRFMVRTHAPQGIEYTVHQGMFVYPVALFIREAKARPELRAQFGADADTFLKFINKHVFEKNEQDWLDMGELGGGYRFEPKVTDRFPNRIMPHNQYGALTRAWLVLRDVEGAQPLMGKRAEQMIRYFHKHLELDEKNDAYRWSYWDWTEHGKKGHSGYEDTSHGHIDVSLAVLAARTGVIFTDKDMGRIANTWLKVMWNQDEDLPKMASGTDGRKPHKFSPLLADWSNLSQWDRKVYDLALKDFLAKKEKERHRWAPTMLVCAKRAGVQLPGLVRDRSRSE